MIIFRVQMDFTANQLVGLLGAHSRSAFSSPPTKLVGLLIAWASSSATWGLAN
jgi:hypothetical protein